MNTLCGNILPKSLPALLLAGAYILWGTSANAKQYRYKVCFTEAGRYTLDVGHCASAKLGDIVTTAPIAGYRGTTSPPAATAAKINPQGVAPSTAAVTPSPDTSAARSSRVCPEGWFSHLVVGDSFTDLNFLNTANCNAAAAKGAQFSWSRDAIAGNSQWSAKGTAAWNSIWLYTPTERPTAPYVNLLAIAPVVNFQRVENTNPKVGATQNVDVLSYGFSSEALLAGVHDPLLNSWQIYLRARGTANGDWEGHTNSWATTFELEPLSDAYRIGSNIMIGNFGYIWVYPLLRTQYFQAMNHSTDPIFIRGNEVLRTGPAISVSLVPQPTGSFDPSKPRPDPQWILNVVYTWYTDVLHGQQFQHWNPSFTYNITDNIGLSAAYESGKIETNGKSINLATVSLTVKN